MTEHLPECMTSVVRMNYDCICPELRACEQRVLDAAEAAVAVLRKLEPEFYVIEVQNAYDLAVINAVAAICALKEKP